jgi:hypothetical protein
MKIGSKLIRCPVRFVSCSVPLRFRCLGNATLTLTLESSVLSVTTFWSFLREFSPLEAYGGGIRHFLMPRPRVSVDVAALFQ